MNGDRIAKVEITILGMINYLFSVISIKSSVPWFKSLDSMVSQYYWKNKKARNELFTFEQEFEYKMFL